MKKLLLILLALLAFTPPQVQARIRVDRIYLYQDRSNKHTGLVEVVYSGVTTNTNKLTGSSSFTKRHY